MTMSKLAVYPGSFDPITFGHADIIELAAKVFDRLIVAVAHESGKEPLFSVAERKALIEKMRWPRGVKVEVEDFDGLLVDYVRRRKADVVVRGLRALSDFEYEFQMAGMNRYLLPDVETMFLTPSDQYQFISGTIVREIAQFRGDVSKFVFPSVERWLKEKIEKMG